MNKQLNIIKQEINNQFNSTINDNQGFENILIILREKIFNTLIKHLEEDNGKLK